jgi:hypothetical protein
MDRYAASLVDGGRSWGRVFALASPGTLLARKGRIGTNGDRWLQQKKKSKNFKKKSSLDDGCAGS